MYNMLIIKYLSIYGCVRMASEQVLMSRLRVLMSRLRVPVASRQVLMRYECRPWKAGGPSWPVALRPSLLALFQIVGPGCLKPQRGAPRILLVIHLPGGRAPARLYEGETA